MRGSLASVVPSRWYENQPLTVLESLGAGVPVIASSLGGLPEIVRDGIDGWVVPPDDPAALAAAIDEVASDPAAARARGLAGRERVLREFSVEAHLARIEQLYRASAARPQDRHEVTEARA